jgi:hypothetical protein
MKTTTQSQRFQTRSQAFGDYLFAGVLALCASLGYWAALLLFTSDAFKVV